MPRVKPQIELRGTSTGSAHRWNELLLLFPRSEALRVELTPEAAEALERADEYARLCDQYIQHDPKIMGGEPVIRGTRVPVRTIASLIEDGESHNVLREDYPHVPEEAYVVAVLWAHANPRRGRPEPP